MRPMMTMSARNSTESLLGGALARPTEVLATWDAAKPVLRLTRPGSGFASLRKS